MTKKEYTQKCKELLKTNDLKKTIENGMLSLIQTEYGYNKFVADAEVDFTLPKIVLNAVLKELAFQFEPLNFENKKKVEGIYQLIKIQ